MKLKEARKRPGQDAQAALTYLRTIQRDMPELSRDAREAWDYLNMLDDELRSEFLRFQHDAHTLTLDYVFREVRRLEYQIKAKNRGRAGVARTTTNSSTRENLRRPTKKRPRRNFRPNQGSSSTKTGSSTRDPNKCLRCGEIGHWAKACPKRRYQSVKTEKDYSKQ